MRFFRILLVILSSAISLTAGTASFGNGQQSGLKIEGCGDFLLHERALDRVFPWRALDGQKEGRLIVFRSLPVFSAESQVVIREQKDGTVHVIYSTLAGEKWSHGLSEYIAGDGSKSDSSIVDDALRGIQVRDKTIEASQELQAAIRAIPTVGVPENLGNNVLLDSNGYEMWATSGSGELYLKSWSGGPMIRWITEVMPLVKSSPGTEVTHNNFAK